MSVIEGINTVMMTCGLVSMMFLLSWPLLLVLDKIAQWRNW